MKFSLSVGMLPVLEEFCGWVGGRGWLWQCGKKNTRRLQGVMLTQEEDKIIWKLTPNKQFIVNSFYRALKTQGCVFPQKSMWKTKFPLKVKVLLWLLVKKAY